MFIRLQYSYQVNVGRYNCWFWPPVHVLLNNNKNLNYETDGEGQGQRLLVLVIMHLHKGELSLKHFIYILP